MELTNNSRFIVNKNAIEYLKSNSAIYTKKEICKATDYNFVYSWDSDFKQFFRIDSEKMSLIAKSYPDTDLLLQNIYFDEIYKNIWKTAIEIAEKLFTKWNEKKLSIINISPLEWAILWSIFRELWLKNIVFNFNRSLLLNSTSKTLEAILFLFSYEKSKFFKKSTTKISQKIETLNLDIKHENYSIIIEENNNKEKYAHINITDYIKSQIGQKEPKNVYRIDKYPKKEFLETKGITQVVIFDSDNDLWESMDYYKKSLWNIKVQELKYILVQKASIWLYEDYLIEKSHEYYKYKLEIEQKAIKNTQNIYNSEVKNKYSPDQYMKVKNNGKVSTTVDGSIVPYLIMFPILLVAFVAADGKWWNLWNNQTYISPFSSSSSSSSISWSSWWNGSSVSSSSSRSSIISSFWGWGFSKWWG